MDAINDRLRCLGVPGETVEVESVGEELALPGDDHRQRPRRRFKLVDDLVPSGHTGRVEAVLVVLPVDDGDIAVSFDREHARIVSM